MPELPEVQTIVAGLAPHLQGRAIEGVTILWPRSVARQNPEDFARRIVGERIEGVWRRGKYIVMELASGQRLVTHLRMTGRLMLRERSAAEDRFTRVALDLDHNQQLRLADARKFARMSLMSQEQFATLAASLGPEPLSEDFTLEVLRAALDRRHTRTKNVLLDQRRLVGLGNIYTDEALFEAGVHPERPAASLAPEEVARLFTVIKQVLSAGVADRGTTFDSYLDAFGHPGGHQHRLQVYRRQGEPCPRCGTPIERIVVGGRGTHYCPSCQPFMPPQASEIALPLQTDRRSRG